MESAVDWELVSRNTYPLAGQSLRSQNNEFLGRLLTGDAVVRCLGNILCCHKRDSCCWPAIHNLAAGSDGMKVIRDQVL